MHDPEKLDQLSPSGCVLPRPAAVVLVKTRRFSALERRSVGAAVTWDALAPGVVICQLAKGHRFSNDDQLTACRAVEAHPGATRLLDLGAGVGSVGLTALSRCGESATLCCVEAQRISHELCRRTVARNGLEHRVACVHADLRDFDGGHSYDLVTGSPPYFDPRDGVPSAHDQKAYCRLEYRGGLDEYCAAAARSLAPGGAAQESEIPNFKASYLGRFPLVLADFWTSDHLLERSRSVDAFFPGARARGTLTLKRT